MYKKNLKYIIIFLIVAFAGIVCYLIYSSYITEKKESDVIVIEEKSYLSDFEVINDTVHIYCVVSLENKSDSGKEVKLIGDLKDEVAGGLLKKSVLEAYFMDEGADTVTVGANSKVMNIKVEFVGGFAGNSQMSSRELPAIEVVNIADR